ncbi:MAG TPA: class I SAM-dependent methyltransferase [Thermomicrobiales bacterium]|nr:class I SAM-dependent methyltransferase [Thermomicrobiales bacterium]
MATTYRATTRIPELVQQAMDLAERMGFDGSCAPVVGRLLETLAGGIRSGVIGEIGSGCGVGTAWMVGALRPGVSIVTVENHPQRAEAVTELFFEHPKVRTIIGDWHVLLTNAPFSMLFADGGNAKQHEPEAVLNAVVPGGLIVLDDLTPEEHWPAEWRGKPDPVREFWLNDDRVHAVELMTSPTSAVILATRIG